MISRRLSAARLLAIALLAPLLGGCISVGIGGDEATPDIRFHTLGDPEPVAKTREIWPVTIAIRRLSVRGRYEARVVEQLGGETLRFREFERWADEPDEAITAAVLESVNTRGNFRAVLPAGSGLRTDLELTGDVLEFDLVRSGDGPLTAVFTARFQLADGAGNLRATARVTGEESLPGRNAEGLGRAMGQAVSRAVGDLLDLWKESGALRPQ